MTITTKYQIGDKVWTFDCVESVRRLQCPDCLDTQTWEAHTPAGEVLTFSCPRCTGWQHDSKPYVREFHPNIRQLTVGSVRVDTHDNERYSYMCEETGVGSGTIWGESRLFDTEEQAQSTAVAKCAILSAEPKRETAYRAAQLAASCTYTSRGIQEAESRRRKFQFRLEDAQRVVFDESLSDGEVRATLHKDLEEV